MIFQVAIHEIVKVNMIFQVAIHGIVMVNMILLMFKFSTIKLDNGQKER